MLMLTSKMKPASNKMSKPLITQGTRDFGPDVVRKRGLPKPLRRKGLRTT